MLWIKAFHIFFMVTWFSGLFYLPRLFVYHAECHDEIGNARFKIMERKLFFGIMTPTAILTLIFGFWLLSLEWQIYRYYEWLYIKLFFVLLVVLYHLYLGKCLFAFKNNQNTHSPVFYRVLNEVPVLFLIVIICLVTVKPWGIIVKKYFF